MNRLFLDKSSKSNKTIVLLTIFPLMAAQICFELPVAQYSKLQTYFANDEFPYYFALIYTLYFLVNSITPIVSGSVRDIIGERFVIVFLSIMTFIGQGIATLGLINQNLLIYGIGRILTGWGIESFLMILTCFISAYNKFDYFTFTVGIYQMFNMFATGLCLWYAPKFEVLSANYIALTVSFVAIFCSVIANIDDDKNEKECLAKSRPIYFQTTIVGLNKQKKQSDIIKCQDGPADNFIQIKEDKEIDPRKSNEQESFKESLRDSQLEEAQNKILTLPIPPLPKLNRQQTIDHWSDVHEFPRIYWLMVLFYVFISTSILALVNVAVEFLKEKWLQGVDRGEELAYNLVILLWTFSGIVTPLFGLVLDFYGHRSLMTILSGLICVWAHLLVLGNQAFEGLLLLTFAFTFSFATIWSGIIYVIQADSYGKSFGILIGLQNVGLALSPLIINYLESFSKTEIFGEFFLIILALVGSVASYLIYSEDYKAGALIDRGMNVEQESIEEQKIQLYLFKIIAISLSQSRRRTSKKYIVTYSVYDLFFNFMYLCNIPFSQCFDLGFDQIFLSITNVDCKINNSKG